MSEKTITRCKSKGFFKEDYFVETEEKHMYLPRAIDGLINEQITVLQSYGNSFEDIQKTIEGNFPKYKFIWKDEMNQ